MQTKPIEVRLNEKQIEVYEVLIEALESSKQVISKFDGKMCNVRLEKALKESQELKDLEVYPSVRKNVFELYAYDRSFKTDPDAEYSCWSYVNHSDINIPISMNGNRIDASKTMYIMFDCISTLRIKIKKLKEANDNFENMVKDYQKIIALIDKYNEDYDISIRKNYRLNRR